MDLVKFNLSIVRAQNKNNAKLMCWLEAGGFLEGFKNNAY